MSDAVVETLKAIKAAQAAPGFIGKAGFNTYEPSAVPTVGPKNYNLDRVVQQLYPVVVPLLKLIPRNVGEGGNAFNFKQITAVNPGKFFSGGVEGKRGKVIDHTFRDVTVKFVTSILENSTTWQGQLSSQGLTPDQRALATETLIKAFVIDEHRNVVGANGTLALGTTNTPVLVGSTTGGSLAAATYSVVAVALTPEGAYLSSLANGVNLTHNQTNQDGSVVSVPGGYAKPSASATVTTTGTTSSIGAVVPWTPGAFAYAWFAGAAGSERLIGISSGNSFTVTALNGTSQLLTALGTADVSVSPLRFDGILTQICTPGSNSIITDLGGDTLTSSGSGSVTEIDEHLTQLWDRQKMSYTHMFVSARTRAKINAIILGSPAGSGSARLTLRGDNTGVTVGTFVTTYTNPATGESIELVTCPDVPEGTILFYSTGVPYALPDSKDIIEMKLNSDYYQVEWPMTTFSYDIAVATYGALVLRFPPAFGLMVNIG